MQEPWHIRRATEGDRQALSRICLETADSGADATSLYSNPDYPGLIWAIPYLEFAPEFAFVLESEDEVLGYVLGAPDTAGFEARLARDWWPRLRAEHKGVRARTTLDRKVLSIIADPQTTPPGRLAGYPAHMHIDLLPKAQGRGWGRRLIERLFKALRAANVPGVHLGVGANNLRALGFYRRLGFEEIGRDGAVWLARRL